MRRQQLIQLLQFLVAWVVVYLFVVFVAERSFVDFILKYWLYLLIVSVSYFYYYSIEYEPDKKYRIIRMALIRWNLYLFAHIFFRPLLNISHELFVILWLVILWLWWTTKMKSRWRVLLQILWWIICFFILISGFFYLYPDAPDIKWFLDWRNYEISVIWATKPIDTSEAYIQITDSRRSSDFQIVPWFAKVLTEDLKISYPSLKKSRDENVVVRTPEWDIFWLFPQSEIGIEFSGNKMVMVSKLSWRIGFLTWIFSWVTSYSWIEPSLTEEEELWMKWAQYTYKQDFIRYLKNQISRSNIDWANNTIMYNIDWKIIKYLVKLFPTSFSKNLRNYNEFQEYFSWIDDDNEMDLSRYSMQQITWATKTSIWWGLKNGINAWKMNMYDIFKKH